ncbi:MAG: VOC family protein [Phycisphaerales bacterium]
MTKTTKRIPAGYHTLTPHLAVRGAAKAIEFYKKAFGAVELHRSAGPDGKLIMHAELRIGDSPLLLHDEFPESGGLSPTSLEGSPVTLHMFVEDADAVFNKAVAAGAKVEMPMQDMFWGDRYGQITDPFGHNWSIAHRLEDLTPEDRRKRAAELFGG